MDFKKLPTMTDEYSVIVTYHATEEQTERKFKNYRQAVAFIEGVMDTVVTLDSWVSVRLFNDTTSDFLLSTGYDTDFEWYCEGRLAQYDGDGFKTVDYNEYEHYFTK